MGNVFIKENIINKFDIENGLLGVERDTFLLLLGYIHFDEDN
jgi:hypothetical protein